MIKNAINRIKSQKTLIDILKQYKFIILLLAAGIPYFFYFNLNTQFTEVGFYSNKIFFTTWSNISFGSFRFFLFPVDYLIYLSSKLFSSELSVKFFYALFLSGSGIATFYVIKKFIKKEIIAFIGALFYMYGIYGQFASFWYPINLLGFILPVITLRILGINKKTNIIFESIVIAFLFFLLTGTNLTFIAYLLIWIAALISYQIIGSGYTNGFKTFLIVSSGGISSLFLSGYYYLTLFAEFHYQSNIINMSLAIESPQWKSSASWLSELIREMGSVNYYYYFKGFSYPNAQPFIHNGFLFFVSFIFPLLAFMSIILYKKRFHDNKILILLYPLLLLLLFMTMGVFYLSPTKDLYQWIYDKVPYFSIFRDAYKPMFLIHFIYAILIAFALNYVYQFKKKWFKWIFVGTLLAVIAISYQFWSGTFLKYEEIAIPQYWQQFANYMSDKRENSVTLTLPNMSFTGYNFTTNKGKNTAFYRPILDNNVIYEEGGSVYDDKLVKSLYTASVSNPTCFARLSGFLGNTYLLNQYDLDTDLYDIGATAEDVNASIQKVSDIQFAKQFGELKLYSISPNLVYDNVYIPTKVISVINTTDYCSLVEKSLGRNTIASVQESKDIQGLSSQRAKIHVTNYNESIYKVNMSDINGNQLLVLNKRYDGGWKIYEVAKDIDLNNFFSSTFLFFQQPIESKHIVTNNFANGWYIKGNGKSQRTFILAYAPQLYFAVGLIISSISAILFVLFATVYFVKKKI